MNPPRRWTVADRWTDPPDATRWPVVVLDVDDVEVQVYDVTAPTRGGLYDPGEPWGWSRTEPEDVDEDALVRALEVWHG
jgi:hypothetical protein